MISASFVGRRGCAEEMTAAHTLQLLAWLHREGVANWFFSAQVMIGLTEYYLQDFPGDPAEQDVQNVPDYKAILPLSSSYMYIRR